LRRMRRMLPKTAGLQHLVVSTAPPQFSDLDILRTGARRGERVWAGAAIVEQRRFVRTKTPAIQATFVDRMKRVDEHLAATPAEVQPRRNDRRIPTQCRFMSLSVTPARPACVSHADNSLKKFSFMPRLYELPYAGSGPGTSVAWPARRTWLTLGSIADMAKHVLLTRLFPAARLVRLAEAAAHP
jgi:hypothetical protein